MNFLEEVKTYDDMCKLIHVDPKLTPDVTAYKERNKAAAVSMFRLWNANEAAWGNVEIDWNDWDQRKYEIWCDLSDEAGSGSGFSYIGYVYDYDCSTVGARLVWPSLEIAKHVFSIMQEDFKNIMKYPN